MSSLPQRIALVGGVYSNYLALEAVLADAKEQGAERVYCLGDLGAFGPYPDRAIEILRQHEIETVRGNYDDSIGRSLADCQCGYTDERDNHFARLSYEYTLKNTSALSREFLRSLPSEIRFEIGGLRVLLCHGSARKMNEFLWESTSSTQFLEHLADTFEADVIAATHTGIPWQRALSRGRLWVNVGAIGRPANDGQTSVVYAMLEVTSAGDRSAVSASFRRVAYDHARLAREMQTEGLPSEFVETIETGWWTTCLEILPAKERKRGRF